VIFCVSLTLSSQTSTTPLKKYLSSYWIRSAVFTFLQRFSLTLFGFVNFIILIRSLTKPEMGVWAFFLIVTTMFETVKANLLKNAHIKFVGNSSKDKTAIASSSFLLNAAITLLFITLLFLLSGKLSFWLGAGTELETMLKYWIPGLIVLIFFSHLEAVSQSHLDFKSIFAGYLSRQVLFFLFILAHFILKIHMTLTDVVVYQSISVFFGTIVIYFFSKKYLLYVFNPTMKWIKQLLGFGGYIFGIGLISNIFASLDQLMIGKFTSSKSMVANYNAASRISALVDIPSYAAAEILLPKVSQIDLTEGYHKVTYMYERMVGILLCMSIPTALVIFIVPRFFIATIAGAQYQDAAFILQMYMLAAMIKPIVNQAANIFLYIGKARFCFFLNSGLLAVNFTLNYLCFTEFGAYGAAVGNIISCVVAVLIWYPILQKNLSVNFLNIIKHAVDTYKIIFLRIVFIRKLPRMGLKL